METHLECRVRMTRTTYIHWWNGTGGLGHLSAQQDPAMSLGPTLGGFLLLLCLGFLFMWLTLHLEQCSNTTCTDILAYDLHMSHTIARWKWTSLKWMVMVSVFLPSLKHHGQNIFSPTPMETFDHWKALLICNPWRPTIALVIPFFVEPVVMNMILF